MFEREAERPVHERAEMTEILILLDDPAYGKVLVF